jgi:hypothetical protein
MLSVDRPTRPGGRGPVLPRWRAVVSAVCIVVAGILLPVSIVTAWARVELVDEDAFVQTLGSLADDPAVQAMIIEETTSAVESQVDFDGLTSDVFDGITGLGVPPRAAAALELLEGPASSGLQTLVSQAIASIVESDAFSDLWATATRSAHRALTSAATADGDGIVVRTDDGVGVQIGVIVDRVEQNLTERGIAVAQLIPAVDRVVIIGEGRGVDAIRIGYAITVTLGWWLPVLVLALFGVGILTARRRNTALIGVGVAGGIGAGALAVILSIGSTAVAIGAARSGLSPSALDVIYGRIVDGMTHTAVVLTALGVLLIVLGWVSGRSTSATRLRAGIRAANAAARQRLRSWGLDTGRIGMWLTARRRFVRVTIAAAGTLWLFALRPITLGDVAIVVLLSLGTAWVLELLQRRPPDEAATGPTGS